MHLYLCPIYLLIISIAADSQIFVSWSPFTRSYARFPEIFYNSPRFLPFYYQHPLSVGKPLNIDGGSKPFTAFAPIENEIFDKNPSVTSNITPHEKEKSSVLPIIDSRLKICPFQNFN